MNSVPSNCATPDPSAGLALPPCTSGDAGLAEMTSLRQEQGLMKAVLQYLHAAIIACDTTGTLSLYNRAAQKLFGLPPEALPPEQWLRHATVFQADGCTPVRLEEQPLHRAWQGEFVRDVELVIQPQYGPRRTVLASARPFFDADKRKLGAVVAFHDITDRERGLAALALAEANFRGIFENAQDGIFQTTADGKYLRINPALARIYGYESPEEMTTTLNDIQRQLYVDPQRRADFVSLMEAHGSIAHFESQVRRKDGTVIWISENARCVRDFAGRLLHYEGTVKDITQQREAEEKLREQAALLDQAPDAIYVRDLEHRVHYWNLGATRLYGWTRAEAAGRSVLDLFYRGNIEPVAAALKLALEHGEWQGELRQLTKSGREILVESRCSLMRNADGQPQSILVINTDITERKRLEAQFLRVQRMEGIGTLASGVAHDLNNCLAPILISAPLLRYKLSPEQVESTLATIETSAQRGADIVKQLLTFGRGVEGARGPVQLKHIINDLVKMARQTFPKSIKLTSLVPSELWTINGDATQLHQVLLNLCVNARDAMPHGGTLSVTAQNAVLDAQYASMNTEARAGSYLTIEVADTGEGIPPAVLDKIFDPFFTTKEPGRGTGLGLSTVLGIVKSHGGFVEVHSQVGKGTAFVVHFPASPEMSVAETDAAVHTPHTGNGELVLIVEDEPTIREATQLTLTTNNYQALTAADGVEALALFAKHDEQIKLVLTDLIMPELDGLGLIRVLRRMSPQTPIIAVTGMPSISGKRETEELNRLNVSRVLAKPYTAEILLAALHDVLAVPAQPSQT